MKKNKYTSGSVCLIVPREESLICIIIIRKTMFILVKEATQGYSASECQSFIST